MANTRTSELELQAYAAHDSRGKPTVAVRLSLGEISTVGDVPAGASKGEDEAQTRPVPEAIQAVHEVIRPLLQTVDLDLSRHASLVALERLLIARGGDNYRELPANAVVPVSRALWRLAARLHGLELYEYLRRVLPGPGTSPRVHFFMNIFNGGLHALKRDAGERLGVDRIDIQEIMVVPVRFTDYGEALAMGERIDAALERLLRDRFPAPAITRGDEAGFTVKGLGSSTEAIGLVFAASEAAGYTPGQDVQLALDVAASSFFDPQAGVYHFQGQQLRSADLIRYYVELVTQYPGKILSIEDGLAENDWDGWTDLTAALQPRGVQTIGDDLFVTQLPRLEQGLARRAATAILIKVNQNGSLLGTLDVIGRAHEAGLHCVVSHRSGETLDDSIADLALATGAFGLKTGDPQPARAFPDPESWVRRAKYLRMVAMEQRG